MTSHIRFLISIILLVTLPVSAYAELPDHIGVITDDLNDEGDWSLDIHANSTPLGASLEPAYPGEVLANHGVRFSPSLSYGLQDNLEISVSIPIVRDDNMGNPTTSLAGGRGRVTWISADEKDKEGRAYWGVTTSLLFTRQEFEYGQTLWDVGLIGGYRAHAWHAAANAFLSNGLANGQPYMAPDLSLNTKLASHVSNNVSAGVEYYFGRVKSWDGVDLFTTRTVFGIVEIEGEKNFLQFGVGRGLNEITDPWTLKLSASFPL